MSPFGGTRTRELTRDTCLKHFAGRDSIESVVLDATTVVADGNGRYIVPLGTFLTKNPAAPTRVKEYVAAGATAEVQTVTITGTPTGGTFTLTFEGETTADIAFNATGAQVATALNALSTIQGKGRVTGGGGPLPGTPVTVTFVVDVGPQALITPTSSLTGGTGPTTTVTRTTAGVASTEAIIGVLDREIELFSNTSADHKPVESYYHSCVFDTSKLRNYNLYGAAARKALPTCSFK